MTQPIPLSTTATIIGAGPAGLMAADILSQANIQVHVFDRMPSVARKLLIAGIGGLNLTHSEAFELFCSRYHPAHIFDTYLQQFGPKQLIEWCNTLGIDTFIGSSGRIFPNQMKAAPLLRQWLTRLKHNGVQFHLRHTWQGWQNHMLCFHDAHNHIIHCEAKTTLLALGGASYPRLGTDGQWVTQLKPYGIHCQPWQASNCGFETPSWSTVFSDKFIGQPLKNISGTVKNAHISTSRQGELMITKQGLEGGLLYALSKPLREQLTQHQTATLYLDLMPQHDIEKLKQLLSKPKGSQSLTNYLRKQLNLQGIKLALIREIAPHSLQCLERLPSTLKNLPITLTKPRPIEEAISSAGGVSFTELDPHLMLKKLPGVFCAGEMLDWDAPTGGYLLTGCFSTGFVAGHAMLNYLKQR